jgi:hypothetical protein
VEKGFADHEHTLRTAAEAAGRSSTTVVRTLSSALATFTTSATAA